MSSDCEAALGACASKSQHRTWLSKSRPTAAVPVCFEKPALIVMLPAGAGSFFLRRLITSAAERYEQGAQQGTQQSTQDRVLISAQHQRCRKKRHALADCESFLAFLACCC